jgi:hypothetical protein
VEHLEVKASVWSQSCRSKHWKVSEQVGSRRIIPSDHVPSSYILSQLVFVPAVFVQQVHRGTVHTVDFSFTSQSRASSSPGQSCVSKHLGTMDAQHILPRFPIVKFRVLIIGRANAGKTSILQRVCDTTESPEIYSVDSSGVRHRVRSRSLCLVPSHHLSRLINSTLQ